MCIVLYSSLRSFLYRNGGFLNQPINQQVSQIIKNNQKKEDIYLFCILKGSTFAPAFREKKALMKMT